MMQVEHVREVCDVQAVVQYASIGDLPPEPGLDQLRRWSIGGRTFNAGRCPFFSGGEHAHLISL
ncbi:hypothetical protein PX554_18160 [Sphingomonas sp. H39-1-10]|uniref:hypothetical protein n=1 Tax=Sphingomonas pollutisoli TaxID=3030829 RepID=UPI0023B8FF0F|nr:hypothetical protein [Sphingomonas pollutisoli]MDF0490062.1 hypothetical protein [Sphingomonas pollutisoli]